MKTIRVLESFRCTGCCSCLSSCPKDAITMVDDEAGFRVPSVDDGLCIQCGICQMRCPVLSRGGDDSAASSSGSASKGIFGFEPYSWPKCFAIKTNPAAMRGSTTVGVSYLLARYFVSHGGYVCGAAFDENFKVKHILTNDMEDLARIRKTKYVQSNLEEGIFRSIQAKLSDAIPVLFMGTPCQVAGLKAFLSKDYETLLAVDLICVGVPSPGAWRKYLAENHRIEDLKDIEFRHKCDAGFRNNRIAFTNKDGVQTVAPYAANAFCNHFSKQICLRESCYRCEFSDLPRVGDLTVGDWWGAPSDVVDSDRGIAVVLTNNERGQQGLELIEKEFSFRRRISLDEAFSGNCARNRQAGKVNANRAKFIELLKSETFSDALVQALYPHFDAILVGCTLNTNYGASITYYALYRIFASMGLNVAIACRPYSGRDDFSVRFFKENTQLAPALSVSKYGDYNKMTDTFIVGSDQVWQYDLFKSSYNETFYLDFADDSKKKIAFASSFGRTFFSLFNSHRNEYYRVSQLMRRFDSLSVRESSGVDIFENTFGLKATHLLDPVFMIDPKDYLSLAERAAHKPEGDYIASYFIYAVTACNRLLKRVKKALGLEMVNMITGHEGSFEKQRAKSVEPVCENLTLEEWLYNIAHSSFVVTNSFHGVCFSIIFRRKFVVMQKKQETVRTLSLLDQLGLSDRLVLSLKEFEERPELLTEDIDYDEVFRRLDEAKSEELAWLKRVISQPKTAIASLGASQKDCPGGLQRATNLADYLSTYRLLQNDYVLLVVAKGETSSDLVARMFAGLGTDLLPYAQVLRQDCESYFCQEACKVVAMGDGGTNTRTFGLDFKPEKLAELKEHPFAPYVFSFDWHAEKPLGRFKVQLAGGPWTIFSDFISLEGGRLKGRFEGIVFVDDKFAEFEGKGLQIRTDGVFGKLCVENPRLVPGCYANVPITKEDVAPGCSDCSGFGLIFDAENGVMKTSKGLTGKLIYDVDDVRLSVDYVQKSVVRNYAASVLACDRSDERKTHRCAKDGLHLALYSKSLKRVVDVSSFSADGRMRLAD